MSCSACGKRRKQAIENMKKGKTTPTSIVKDKAKSHSSKMRFSGRG